MTGMSTQSRLSGFLTALTIALTGCAGCGHSQTMETSAVLERSAATSPIASEPHGSGPSTANTAGELPFSGQKLCPVSDEALGSMGPPVPVVIKGETIYVCCKGCIADVQSDPDAILAKVHAENHAAH